MKDELQKSMTQFFAEAKLIDGTENAIYELSEEVGNCIIISGEIYGKNTKDKIDAVGKKHGLIILAQELSVLYKRPRTKKKS